MTITSDAHNKNSIIIPLYGFAAAEPSIHVEHDDLTYHLIQGNSTSEPIFIRNDGGSNLVWSIDIEYSNAEHWISIDEHEGVLDKDQQQELTLYVNAQLEAGEHSASLIFSSDPLHLKMESEIQLIVELPPLGISSKEDAISIYPNPSEGQIKIEIRHAIFNRIEVLNLAGQVVLNKKIDNKLSHVLNLDNINAGIYYLKFIQAENQPIIKKIFLKRN
ncbi:MAG: T9SS type A sorting domain-containing protein [Reichenbachiella sp.]